MAKLKNRKPKVKPTTGYMVMALREGNPRVAYFGTWKSPKVRKKALSGHKKYKCFVNMYSMAGDTDCTEINYEGEFLAEDEDGNAIGMAQDIYTTMKQVEAENPDIELDYFQSHAKIRLAKQGEF